MILVVQQTVEYIMQVVRAAELFNNIKNIAEVDFERINDIDIDFSNVSSIDLKAINALLNMQKVAVLNNKTLSISNVCPQIRQILDVTGLGKSFEKNAANPIKA